MVEKGPRLISLWNNKSGGRLGIVVGLVWTVVSVKGRGAVMVCVVAGVIALG
jgi:hypothetical protein